MAQWKAQQAAKRPKTAKLVGNPRLREYVRDRLAGSVRGPDGTIIEGPTPPPWKGLNKPRRQDRRWSAAWSPEQISHRLRLDFPDDESTRISHEAIYQSLFIEAVAHSNASWSRVCARAAHCANPGPDRGTKLRAT